MKNKLKIKNNVEKIHDVNVVDFSQIYTLGECNE